MTRFKQVGKAPAGMRPTGDIDHIATIIQRRISRVPIAHQATPPAAQVDLRIVAARPDRLSKQTMADPVSAPVI
ncbi:hypothetical protein QNN87_26085 [Citrobacter sp. C411]